MFTGYAIAVANISFLSCFCSCFCHAPTWGPIFSKLWALIGWVISDVDLYNNKEW